MSDMEELILKALQFREKNGGSHLHHSQCIHNLLPIDQVKMHSKSVDWWMTVIGSMPVQITPEQWQVDPPNLLHGFSYAQH
jgi:hypothetical protein